MVILFAAISRMTATPANPGNNLLSLDRFYPVMHLVYDFRFDDAERLLESQTGLNAENKIARMNLLWWKAMTDGNNQIYFEELKDLSGKVLNEPQEIDNKKTIENVSRLTAGIYLIRIAAINDNKTAAFRTFLQILPNLKEILDAPFAYEEYTLLSGVYHYAIGSLKKHFYFLRPFFLLMPPTESETGKKLLMLCSQSKNNTIATEARYFLFKIEKEINSNLPLAEEHLNSLLNKHPGNIVYRLELLNLYSETQRDSEKMENEIRDLIGRSSLHPSQKSYLQSLVVNKP
jgi:hypothetical protein